MKKTIIAALTLCAPFALVGCGGPPEEELSETQIQQKVNKGVERVLDRVDADETQKARVKLMARDLVLKGRKLKESHKGTKQQLKAQWNSARPDRKQVHRILDKQIDGVRALIHEVADKVVDLHAILTPQQRQELQQLGEKFHKHRRGHGFFKHGH